MSGLLEVIQSPDGFLTHTITGGMVASALDPSPAVLQFFHTLLMIQKRRADACEQIAEILAPLKPELIFIDAEFIEENMPQPTDRPLATTRTGEPKCRCCNCTEDKACWPPCSWAEPDLCSACKKLKDALQESYAQSAAPAARVAALYQEVIRVGRPIRQRGKKNRAPKP